MTKGMMNEMKVLKHLEVSELMPYYTKEQALEFASFMINTIKLDIRASYAVDPYYKVIEFFNGDAFIPKIYYDKIGNECSAIRPEGKVLDFEKDFVVSFPCNILRAHEALKNVSENGFVYDKWNHQAVYYDFLDIGIAENGFHSINAAAYLKTGKMKADAVDMKLLYKHIRTDGYYWYDKHSGKELSRVQDFRFAILYEAGRKKLDIMKEKDWT